MELLLRLCLITLVVTAAAFALHLGQVPQTLGAHPWWAHTVLLVGCPAGLILAVLAWMTGWRRTPRALGFAVLAGGAYGVAHLGKIRFAASYAEDAVAGQMWFYGWIVTCCFAAALLATLFLSVKEPR